MHLVHREMAGDVNLGMCELRAKEDSEAELQKQLISSEAAKEQLAHDYQEQERSLKIAEAISAGIPKQIAKATEPSTAEELRAQMLQIVDAELGSLEVSPAEPVPRAGARSPSPSHRESPLNQPVPRPSGGSAGGGGELLWPLLLLEPLLLELSLDSCSGGI